MIEPVRWTHDSIHVEDMDPDGRYPAEFVDAAAFDALKAERDELAAKCLAYEGQGAVHVVARPLRERAVSAEAGLREALDLIERYWKRLFPLPAPGAAESWLQTLESDTRVFLSRHGRGVSDRDFKPAPELALTGEDREKIAEAIKPFDEARKSAKTKREVRGVSDR